MSDASILERFGRLAEGYRRGLLDDCLPFWLRHGLDREYGGLLTSLDRDGSVLDTDKAVWLQGRFAWIAGHLYNTVEKRPEWLDAAESTLRFLQSQGFDTDGRMFFQVTRDGRPIRKRRYAFSEAFAAMAFGEHARATASPASKATAERLYRAFAGHTPTPPKFTDVRAMKSMAGPMIRVAVAQSLRASIAFAAADEEIDRAIGEIRRDFMKPEIRCCMENVGPAGERLDGFDGRLLNPGHAIEGAWFMMREGELRGRPEYVRAGCDVLDWMWERGWDREYGGMLYFRDVEGKPSAEYWHDMKFWWPQNETIVATLLAYRLTGDPRYAAMHAQVHDYAYGLFPDPDFGEWFGYFHRDGRLSTPLKGNLFKGCFHVPRQALEGWRIARDIAAGRIGPANP
jgi:N-acylglucosamine 2-epimerase